MLFRSDDGRSHIDVFSLGPAYLGPSQTPFIVAGDPSRAEFRVKDLEVTQAAATRLEDRMHLLSGMDRLRRDLDASGTVGAMDRFNQRALGMLTSATIRDAFDLSREPQAVRDRYGWNAYGQRGLLARRLVEAGCPFVTMVWENPFPGRPIPAGCTYNWEIGRAHV